MLGWTISGLRICDSLYLIIELPLIPRWFLVTRCSQGHFFSTISSDRFDRFSAVQKQWSSTGFSVYYWLADERLMNGNGNESVDQSIPSSKRSGVLTVGWRSGISRYIDTNNRLSSWLLALASGAAWACQWNTERNLLFESLRSTVKVVPYSKFV